MKTVFVLFQTDVWQSYSSRVFFGVFSSKVKAIDAAKENGLYHSDAEVVIIECEMNKFGEV